MKLTPLDHRTFIHITGTECRSFLQGLITVNIDMLSPENALWTGLLSPQGKALFDFFIYEFPNINGIFIDIHKDQIEALTDHLKKYKLRSDVTLNQATDFNCVSVWGTHDFPLQIPMHIFQDPRHSEMGYRIILSDSHYDILMETYKDNVAPYQDYIALRIDHMITDPAEDLLGIDFYWPEIHAEKMNGLDYKKGCYVGQEVTARLKHKTELKREIVRFYVMGNPITPIKIATDVQEIGTLLCLNNNTHQGLAYVNLRYWKKAQETLRSIVAGDTIIKIIQDENTL